MKDIKKKESKRVGFIEVSDWLIKDKELHKGILEQFGIESKIEGSIDGVKRVYNFIGGGCGFSWFEFDKRSKLLRELDKDQRPLFDGIHMFKSWFKQTYFTPEQFRDYRERGVPIDAVLSQDMNIKKNINLSIKNYLVEEHGVNPDSITVRYRYD